MKDRTPPPEKTFDAFGPQTPPEELWKGLGDSRSPAIADRYRSARPATFEGSPLAKMRGEFAGQVFVWGGNGVVRTDRAALKLSFPPGEKDSPAEFNVEFELSDETGRPLSKSTVTAKSVVRSTGEYANEFLVRISPEITWQVFYVSSGDYLLGTQYESDRPTSVARLYRVGGG